MCRVLLSYDRGAVHFPEHMPGSHPKVENTGTGRWAAFSSTMVSKRVENARGHTLFFRKVTGVRVLQNDELKICGADNYFTLACNSCFEGWGGGGGG